MQQMTMAERGTPVPRWEEPGVKNVQKEQQSVQMHATALGADFGAPQSASLSPMTSGVAATAGPAQMRKSSKKSGALQEPQSQEGQGGGAAPVKTYLNKEDPEYWDYADKIEKATGMDVTRGDAHHIFHAWHEIDFIKQGRANELFQSPSANLPEQEAYADIFKRYGL